MIEQVGVTRIMVTHDQGRSHDHGQPGGHHVGRPTAASGQPQRNLRAAQLPLHRRVYWRNQSVQRPGGGGRSRPCADRQRRAAPADLCRYGITGTLACRWVSLRPERVGLSRSAPAGDCNHDQGTVHDIAYLGGFSIYHIQLASGKIVKASVPATAGAMSRRRPGAKACI